MNDEVWAACPYSANYLVSTLGRVKRAARVDTFSSGRIRVVQELVLKPIMTRSGYPAVKISGKQRHIHRLVLETFAGQPTKEAPWAAHWNGDRTDNRLANLRWASPQENSNDRIRHGRSCRGLENRSAKLKPEDVLAIRNDPRQRKQIAADYGVTPEAISHIVLRKNWKWL